MPDPTFKALLLNQVGGGVSAEFAELPLDYLPGGEVLVRVAYSSLNFKDGLAVSGKGKIARRYPMVPGVDLVGTVIESTAPLFQPGDWVIATGWGLGEIHWGGYAELARVPADWLVPLPDRFSPAQAMAIGTAGLTAMLAVQALETHGCEPAGGEVVVTGASGGVGGLAVAILGGLGYKVMASTGRSELADYLASLGAAGIIERAELARLARPLETRRWAGAIDNVGGTTLATLLSTMNDGGTVASVGLAGGAELATTVYPFILRGVNLVGINSTLLPRQTHLALWERLARDLPVESLNRVMQIAPLADIHRLSEQIVAGQTRGRVVIRVAEGKAE